MSGSSLWDGFLIALLGVVIGAQQGPDPSCRIEASELVENCACEAPKNIEILSDGHCLSTLDSVRLRPSDLHVIPVPNCMSNLTSVKLLIKRNQLIHNLIAAIVR